MGTPDFAAAVLRTLLTSRHTIVGVVSQPTRASGRGLSALDPAAAAFARERGLPLWQPEKLNEPSVLDELRALEPDLILTAAYGKILRPRVLELPKRGSWNVHGSLLPRHRGASPVAATILAGDAWTGITLFQMDAGMDTGPILLQEMFPVLVGETSGELMTRLAELGGRLSVQALDRAEAGPFDGVAQPAVGATYTRMMTKEDGRLRWNRSASEVERWVRAVTPWPGAFSYLQGQRLRIHRVRPLHEVHSALAPGTLLSLPDGLGVVTLPGVVMLEEVQLEGRKRQPAAAFLRGFPLEARARFTDEP